MMQDIMIRPFIGDEGIIPITWEYGSLSAQNGDTEIKFSTNAKRIRTAKAVKLVRGDSITISEGTAYALAVYHFEDGVIVRNNTANRAGAVSVNISVDGDYWMVLYRRNTETNLESVFELAQILTAVRTRENEFESLRNDWGVVTAQYDIPSPTPKTKAINVLGADGVLDIASDTQTPFSEVKGTFELIVYDGLKFDFDAFKEKYHWCKIAFRNTKDPDHFRIGRCWIKSEDRQDILRKITMELLVEPWRYLNELNSVQFEFESREGADPTFTSVEWNMSRVGTYIVRQDGTEEIIHRGEPSEVRVNYDTARKELGLKMYAKVGKYTEGVGSDDYYIRFTIPCASNTRYMFSFASPYKEYAELAVGNIAIGQPFVPVDMDDFNSGDNSVLTLRFHIVDDFFRFIAHMNQGFSTYVAWNVFASNFRLQPWSETAVFTNDHRMVAKPNCYGTSPFTLVIDGESVEVTETNGGQLKALAVPHGTFNINAYADTAGYGILFYHEGIV